jgi:hypothetical protein
MLSVLWRQKWHLLFGCLGEIICQDGEHDWLQKPSMTIHACQVKWLWIATSLDFKLYIQAASLGIYGCHHFQATCSLLLFFNADSDSSLKLVFMQSSPCVCLGWVQCFSMGMILGSQFKASRFSWEMSQGMPSTIAPNCIVWIHLFFADSTSAWLQHIGHKFHEVLQVKMRQMQDMPTSTDAEISVSVDVSVH